MTLASPVQGGLVTTEPGWLRDTWLPPSTPKRSLTPERATGSSTIKWGRSLLFPMYISPLLKHTDSTVFLIRRNYLKLLTAKRCSPHLPGHRPPLPTTVPVRSGWEPRNSHESQARRLFCTVFAMFLLLRACPMRQMVPSC